MKADQGNNLSEMVYHYLLDMILSMKIKPGRSNSGGQDCHSVRDQQNSDP